MASTLLPDRLYFVNVRHCDDITATPNAVMGFKNSAFGFHKYHLAIQMVDFLKNRPPEIFYTNVRANTFRIHINNKPDNGDVYYDIIRTRREDYCADLLAKNVSIRLIENVDAQPDLPELLLTSPFKVDPELHAINRAFLEKL